MDQGQEVTKKRKRYLLYLTRLSLTIRLHVDRFLFEETAEVVVGKDKVKYIIYTDVLCKRSNFFKSAYSKRWSFADKPIQLPDQDPEIFSHYLSCVYGGELRSENEEKSQLMHLAQLYILADALGDLKSANMAIDEFIRYSDEKEGLPGIQTTTLVMEATLDNSPLRQLIVDYYVHEASAKWFNGDVHGIEPPKELFQAVAKEYVRLKYQAGREDKVTDVFDKRKTDSPRCQYHQHDVLCPQCEEDSSGSESESE